MKKIIRMMIIMAVLTAVAVVAIFLLKRQSLDGGLNAEDTKRMFETLDVVCWGDSLTEGIGGNGTNYPKVLEKNIREYVEKLILESGQSSENQKLLFAEAEKVKVYNEGISGESSLSIAARAGGVLLKTTEELHFGWLDKKKEISFLTEDGRVAEPWHSDELGPADVTVNGIDGKLRFNNKEYRYYFQRDGWGMKENIPSGTTIMVLGPERYQDAFTVIFMGQNGGYTDFADLIAQQKSMIPQNILEERRFLILGLTSGTREERKQLEDAMEEAFGENYVNLREALSGERVAEYVTELSQEDYQSMEKGEVPQALRAPQDMVHLNEHGYEMIGDIVFERMQKMGVFDTIRAEIQNFSQ